MEVDSDSSIHILFMSNGRTVAYEGGGMLAESSYVKSGLDLGYGFQPEHAIVFPVEFPQRLVEETLRCVRTGNLPLRILKDERAFSITVPPRQQVDAFGEKYFPPIKVTRPSAPWP